MKMKIVLGIWCLCLVLTGEAMSAQLVDEILAIVNDEVITQQDFKKALQPIYAELTGQYSGGELNKVLIAAQYDVLERMINARLMLQEAKRLEIEVTDAEIQDSLAAMKNRFTSEGAFEEALHSQGLQVWDLEEKHRENIMVKRLVQYQVGSYVTVSPTDIATYYNGHNDEFNRSAEWKVSHIVIHHTPDDADERARQRVKAVESALDRGEEFAAIARQYSDGPRAERGGDMGFVKAEMLIGDLGAMLSELSVGVTAGPVMTEKGYHFLRVNDMKPAKHISIHEARDEIQQIVWQKKYKKRLDEWIDTLRQNAYIVIKSKKH